MPGLVHVLLERGEGCWGARGARSAPEHGGRASLLAGDTQRACLCPAAPCPQLSFFSFPGSVFGQRSAFACPEQMLSGRCWASTQPGGEEGGAELPAAMQMLRRGPPIAAGREASGSARLGTHLQNLSRPLQRLCWILLPLGTSQPAWSTGKETTR